MSRYYDAEFYTSVHQMLLHRDAIAGDDRRQQSRRAFRHYQPLAAIHDGQIPHWEEFRTVCCHDLSETGFSFLADRPWPTEQVAVAFGTETRRIFIIADVLHSQPVGDVDRPLVYRVGCRFVERLERLPE